MASVDVRKDPPFLTEAKKLGHPKLALISARGDFVEFLADRVGKRWPQHVYSLGITNYVDYVLHKQSIDQATREKLEAYRRREQVLLLGDVAKERPDAVIVEEKWAQAHLPDKMLQSMLQDYRLVSVTGSGTSDLDPLLQFYVLEPLAN